MSHGRLFQSRVKNAFDKRVCPHMFSEGDLVLKKVSQVQNDHRGKLAQNYEGPFVAKKAFSGGALLLPNMDDEELPSPVNFDVDIMCNTWGNSKDQCLDLLKESLGSPCLRLLLAPHCSYFFLCIYVSRKFQWGFIGKRIGSSSI